MCIRDRWWIPQLPLLASYIFFAVPEADANDVSALFILVNGVFLDVYKRQSLSYEKHTHKLDRSGILLLP